jgi:hypothetical protein
VVLRRDLINQLEESPAIGMRQKDALLVISARAYVVISGALVTRVVLGHFRTVRRAVRLRNAAIRFRHACMTLSLRRLPPDRATFAE